ncbi:MAG: acyltransferase [Chitinophagaceae bacterium]|nr:acyltransferase [Chitinophagaceae bacterium]
MALQSATSRLSGLDLLRAIAITLVFLFHYGSSFPHPAWVNTISKFGWTGVDLFFVLSGYLIASQLFEKVGNLEKISLREFFVKRFFRIVPPYLLVVAVYFLIPSSRERDTIAPLWKYLTFTQNLGLDLPTQGTFSHAWSLCIEEQFYLLLPLILCVLLYCRMIKSGAILLLLLFLSGFAIRLFCWRHFAEPLKDSDLFWVNWYKWIYYPTFCRLDGLLSGVAIAAVFQFNPALTQRIRQHGNSLLLVSLAMLALAYYLCLDEHSFGATIFGFPLVDTGYGVMVLGAISNTSFVYSIRSKNIVRIATFSYSIYLTHKIIIHAVQNGLFRSGIIKESNLVFFTCTAACLLVAFIINILVEKPVLKFRNHVIRKLM